jgi:outer membrane protein assembly factor BamB
MAIWLATGKPRWIYDLQGRISSRPSVVGNRVCITTYTGAVGCFSRRDGHKLWLNFYRRDAVQWEGFYASPSTDGSRIFTVALSGTVYALSVRDGHTLWTYHLNALTYGTPSISHGRVFVATLGGGIYAFRTTTGTLIWSKSIPGRVLGPTLVSGPRVFYSTLEGRTYAADVRNGKTVWQFAAGKYAPGISTASRYYFSLNGLLVAFRGKNGPKKP